uniref:Uncharacterized protein n=1 Tax=Lactuca sativa TaxID=4236 RepID=A0A9R1XRI9_LACSA|nr:hypothetical protein LSAT_V11C200085650 [Lactuca sativa]
MRLKWAKYLLMLASCLEGSLPNHYEGAIECTDHALIGCRYAKMVTQCVLKWCGVPMDEVNTVNDMITYANSRFECAKKRKLLMGICYDYKEPILS